MNKFYMTFGQKYRHEEHPQGGHPDGYFVINAENIEEAREKAFAHCGPQFSTVRSENEMTFRYYPNGCLKTI